MRRRVKMDKIILNRETRVEDNVVVIKEETETKLTKERLEMRLRDLDVRKQRLKDQNKRIIEEFEELKKEELETKELIKQLDSEEDGVETI